MVAGVLSDTGAGGFSLGLPAANSEDRYLDPAVYEGLGFSQGHGLDLSGYLDDGHVIPPFLGFLVCTAFPLYVSFFPEPRQDEDSQNDDEIEVLGHDRKGLLHGSSPYVSDWKALERLVHAGFQWLEGRAAFLGDVLYLDAVEFPIFCFQLAGRGQESGRMAVPRSHYAYGPAFVVEKHS
jgi:hypothetical protein